MQRRRTFGPLYTPRRAAWASFVVGNLVTLSFIYASPACGLFVQPARAAVPPLPPVKDAAVEAWLWFVVLASWAAYAGVQGSSPGFAGAAAATPAGASAAAPEAEDDNGYGVVDARTISVGAAADDASASGAPPAAPPAAGSAPVCERCVAPQVPRAHHCRACDRCVATFDHHCSLIATCIGERNHARFWCFVLAQAAAVGTAIGVLNTGFVWTRNTSDWVGLNLSTLLLLVLLWILQVGLIVLLVLHSWLAATNTTTYETIVGAQRLWYLRAGGGSGGTGGAGSGGAGGGPSNDDEPKDCDLPFSSGLCTNLALFCRLDAWDCCRRGAEGAAWVPHAWRAAPVDRDSTTVIAWENRYFSMC